MANAIGFNAGKIVKIKSGEPLDVGTNGILKTDTISESQANSGVAVDSVLLKDGNIVIADNGNIGSASDTDAIAISSGGIVSFTQNISFVDGGKVVLGGDSDIGIQYDEAVTDSLLISADVDGAALGVVFAADRGDLAADKWKMGFADNGTFTITFPAPGGTGSNAIIRIT